MKFSKSDIPLMRRSIMAVCASALIGGLVVYASEQRATLTQRDRLNAQNQLNAARSRLISVQRDETNMHSYFAEHLMLEQQKIFGEDRRLDWIEGLEKIRLKNLVTDFRYNIAPQRIYTPQPPIDSGNFDIRYSEMKLQFELLHEAQLMNFFNALRADIDGWYQLEGCTLQRSIAAIDEDNDNPTAAAYLKAECSGGWITLKNRNASK